MEAILKKNKVAREIKTGNDIVLLEAGDCVAVEQVDEYRFAIAEGQRYEGLTLGRPEITLLLSVPEVAERVNRSTATIYSWLRDGVIEGHKISGPGKGGEWRVPASELDNLTMPKPGPKGGDDA